MINPLFSPPDCKIPILFFSKKETNKQKFTNHFLKKKKANVKLSP